MFGLIPWLALKFVARGRTEQQASVLAKIVVFGTLIAAVLAIVFAVVKIHDHRVIAAHDDKQAVQTMQAERKATDQAATERASDTIAIAKQSEETRNVIIAEPDQPIAPTSRALACKRLRDVGRIPPACR